MSFCFVNSEAEDEVFFISMKNEPTNISEYK
jgi:hypothetical protein